MNNNFFILGLFICLGMMGNVSVVHASTYDERGGATLRWLDKATARTGTIDLKRDESAKFDDITVRLKSCRTLDPLEGNDAAAFVQVWETKGKSDPTWIFSGWMYASNPGVAAVDHPILDVWLLSCAPAPKEKAEQSSDGDDVIQADDDTIVPAQDDPITEELSDELDGQSTDAIE